MAVRTTWTAGDVLTAADLTDTFGAKANLASPTFTGTPAAPTAAAGTNTTQLATTAFVQAASGLTLITTQSFSAVSSVSVNNCFSGNYDNYRVIFTGTASTGIDVRLRLRAAGTDNTTASSYISNLINGTGATVAGQTDTQDYWNFSVGNDVTVFQFAAEFRRPFAAEATGFLNHGARSDRVTIRGGYHNQATSYDGMTIYGSSGTLTGTVSVYGYKK